MYTDYPREPDGLQPYDLGAAILHALSRSALPLAIGEATGPKRGMRAGDDTGAALRAYKREWMRAKREGKR